MVVGVSDVLLTEPLHGRTHLPSPNAALQDQPDVFVRACVWYLHGHALCRCHRNCIVTVQRSIFKLLVMWPIPPPPVITSARKFYAQTILPALLQKLVGEFF